MSNVSQHEQLLSALVDGQLADNEREDALRLIAANPEYALYVNELKAQRERFRNLPKFTLPADFSQRVLAKAEAQGVDVSTKSVDSAADQKSADQKSADQKSVNGKPVAVNTARDAVFADAEPKLEYKQVDSGKSLAGSKAPGSRSWLSVLGAIGAMAAMLFIGIYLGGLSPVGEKPSNSVASTDTISENEDTAVLQYGAIAPNGDAAEASDTASDEREIKDGAGVTQGELNVASSTLDEVEREEMAMAALIQGMNGSGNGVSEDAIADNVDASNSGVLDEPGSIAQSAVAAETLQSPLVGIEENGQLSPEGIAIGPEIRNALYPSAGQNLLPANQYNEIMIVDLESRDQLAVVQQVLRDNSISGSIAGTEELGEADTIGQQLADTGAIYVMASPSQMKQAILQLNDNAGFTSYQLPSTGPRSYADAAPSVTADMIDDFAPNGSGLGNQADPETSDTQSYVVPVSPNVVLPRGQLPEEQRIQTDKIDRQQIADAGQIDPLEDGGIMMRSGDGFSNDPDRIRSQHERRRLEHPEFEPPLERDPRQEPDVEDRVDDENRRQPRGNSANLGGGGMIGDDGGGIADLRTYSDVTGIESAEDGDQADADRVRPFFLVFRFTNELEQASGDTPPLKSSLPSSK